MDGMNDFEFIRAADYKERHGLFIALVGGTNSGKSWSAMRLAQGIARAQGKRVAAIDTEGGRILHLKDDFDFDVFTLRPPHRPQRYLAGAQYAETKGYGCLLVDSFSMEWRGEGGKLQWTDDELEKIVARKRKLAEEKNWSWDEDTERFKGKAAASIEPSMAHKAMEFGMLQLKMPIIFSIRGADTYDPDKRKAVFKAQCRQDFLFDVTVSFRLARDKKGIIDLSDATTWKMEKSHQGIFKDGEQLSERHGEMINAWATNEAIPQPMEYRWENLAGRVFKLSTPQVWRDRIVKTVKEWGTDVDAQAWMNLNHKNIAIHMEAHPEECVAIFNAFADRGVYPPSHVIAGEDDPGGARAASDAQSGDLL